MSRDLCVGMLCQLSKGAPGTCRFLVETTSRLLRAKSSNTLARCVVKDVNHRALLRTIVAERGRGGALRSPLHF